MLGADVGDDAAKARRRSAAENGAGGLVEDETAVPALQKASSICCAKDAENGSGRKTAGVGHARRLRPIGKAAQPFRGMRARKRLMLGICR